MHVLHTGSSRVGRASSKQSLCPLNCLRCCSSLLTIAAASSPFNRSWLHCAEAKRLTTKGAQVIKANVMDAASLRAAFEGAYGVFAMTPVLRHGGIDSGYVRELEQGANAQKLCGQPHGERSVSGQS